MATKRPKASPWYVVAEDVITNGTRTTNSAYNRSYNKNSNYNGGTTNRTINERSAPEGNDVSYRFTDRAETYRTAETRSLSTHSSITATSNNRSFGYTRHAHNGRTSTDEEGETTEGGDATYIVKRSYLSSGTTYKTSSDGGRGFFSKEGTTQKGANSSGFTSSQTSRDEVDGREVNDTDYEAERYYITVKTSKTQETTNTYSYETTTTSTDISFTRLAANLIDTEIDSYSIKTTKTSYVGTMQRTFDTVSEEEKELTNYPRGSYTEQSVSGGAYFLSGGTSITDLSNLVSGASAVTSIRENGLTQPNLVQVFQGVRDGDQPDFTVTLTSTSFHLSDANKYTFASSSHEATRVRQTTSTYDTPVGFDASKSTGLVFTTETFKSRYWVPSNTTRFYTSSTYTRTRRNDSTYTVKTLLTNFNNFIFSTITETFSGSDGILTNTTNDRPDATGIGTDAWDAGGVGANATNRETRSSLSIAGQEEGFNIRTTRINRHLITLEKGLEGGVQYSTSTDVSGAIREGKNATIGHAIPTTTTSNYNLTTAGLNTTESNTYESAGIPLYPSAISLNRYATYLPANELGDFRYEVINANGDDEGDAHLIQSRAGSSLIRYTKNMTYSTSNSDGSNNKTLSTALNGIFKVEQGGQDTDLQRIRVIKSIGQKHIFGGFVYTDEAGSIKNNNNFPTTFYAFDKDSSTRIEQEISDMGEHKHQSLPEKAMIFLNLTTIPKAFSKGGYFGEQYDTIDRKLT